MDIDFSQVRSQGAGNLAQCELFSATQLAHGHCVLSGQKAQEQGRLNAEGNSAVKT